MKKFLILLLISALTSACQTNPGQTETSASTIAGPEALTSDSGAIPEPRDAGLSMEEICALNPCRKDVHIKFRTEGDPVDETLPVYWPRVLNNVISVLPGESFFVEADVVDGKLVNMKEVADNVNPERTISIKLNQMEGDVGMMLLLSNPFEGVAIKFNMQMMDFNGNLHKTSSCAAGPKMSIYEHWPHPVPELIIKNPVVRTVKAGDSIRCEY